MDMYVDVLKRIQHQFRLKEKELGLLDEIVKQEKPAEKEPSPAKWHPQKSFKKKQKEFKSRCKVEITPVKPMVKEVEKKQEPAKLTLSQKEMAAVMQLKMQHTPDAEIMERLNISQQAFNGFLEECKKYKIKF